jgi:hypothetical protein
LLNKIKEVARLTSFFQNKSSVSTAWFEELPIGFYPEQLKSWLSNEVFL